MIAAIVKVKEAEDACEAEVKKATETAQEILKKATGEARDRRKAITDEMRLKRAEMLNKARQEAENACIPLDEAAKQEIGRILHPDEAAFNEAVNTLVETIMANA